jgi:squalene synthase HpnC
LRLGVFAVYLPTLNSDLLHPSPRAWSLTEAYDWCQRLASSHYENFPVASRLLPRSVRPHVAAVYAFARIADDIADEPGPEQSERLELLEKWSDGLQRSYRGEADHPVFVALAETVSRHRIPIELLLDLLSAFRQDVTVHRYETFGDLLDYCRRSANPVGRIVLRLFGHADADLDRDSDAICTALQLTNFWQDVRTDAERGRMYIPREDLRRFNCREDLILRGTMTEPFSKTLAFEVDRTRALFHRGTLLPESLRQPLRIELRLTWLGGMRILDKIEQSGYTVLEHRPTLGTMDLPGLLFRSLRRL